MSASGITSLKLYQGPIPDNNVALTSCKLWKAADVLIPTTVPLCLCSGFSYAQATGNNVTFSTALSSTAPVAVQPGQCGAVDIGWSCSGTDPVCNSGAPTNNSPGVLVTVTPSKLLNSGCRTSFALAVLSSAAIMSVYST
ncbi:hypothetical protein BV898_05227 [Hypsibius exemplaris]|uniref:Uncharacterized protein n=1 Tax=Hypsibius exemplaris TaxID=2072580 RepID=A0A1W0X085_HYPEX|nr:hypothetical protein BV898_05227 [Hypsibius exemplaris]